MIDESIQQYFIKGELGRGGMATVYLAHDQKFNTNVAIKVLNKEFVNNENIRKRFLAEARNMYRMSHPNIIKVTDLIDENDTVAFVMEHIDGETLKEYLERMGRLSDTEIKGLFTQMLDAVGYVHEQNLVHRDIKPSNFMLDRKGKVKIMDFGIAKTMDANSAEFTQTGTGVQMGTPMYMSPEQIVETKNVSAQSDIYSMGVVLWQMVTGRKPYDTATLSSFQMQVKIVNEPLAGTNTSWDRYIRKATAKEVTLRYAGALEFKKVIDDDINKNNPEADKTVFENNFKSQSQSSRQDSGSSKGVLEHFDLDMDEEVDKLIVYVQGGSDKFYYKHYIPSGKLSNFKSRVYSLIKEFKDVEFYFYYDDTIWGKGDDGWAIIRVANGKWFFLIAPYKDNVSIFTLNFKAPKLNRLRAIEGRGLLRRDFNILFENCLDNYENYQIKYNVSAIGCGDFFEMLNLILEQ